MATIVFFHILHLHVSYCLCVTAHINPFFEGNIILFFSFDQLQITLTEAKIIITKV